MKKENETSNNSSNSDVVVLEKKGNISKRGNAHRQNTLPLHIMLIPGIILVLIYCYAPMLGIIIAFQDFNPAKNSDGSIFSLFFSSPWTTDNGLGHFKFIFGNADAMQAIINTIIIAVWKIITMFFAPIILALSLNEVRKSFLKRTVQTIVYLPHFLSWVILAGILFQLLSTNGIVNSLLSDTVSNYSPVSFLQMPNLFRPLVIITNIWKEIGWSTIIYLAAISGVDPTLYEAAVMDGAGKVKQCWHITLPGMKAIIVLSLVLSLQGILNAGFDQIFNMYSVDVYSTGDIIDTYIYRIGFRGGEYSLGAAVGLFKSVISLILITISYWLAYEFAGYEIF